MNKPDYFSAGVEVGEHAPDFAALDLQGNTRKLGSIINGGGKERKTLLIFYRGGWCPFCNEQLAAISRDYQKFKDQKVSIVVVSAEEIEKGKDLSQKLKLPFTLLSDSEFEGIDRYGVRETNVSEQLKLRGITAFSRPASFIIDETGIIRYKYIGKNASDRPKNEDLLRVFTDLDRSGISNASSDDREDDEEEMNACRLPSR